MLLLHPGAIRPPHPLLPLRHVSVRMLQPLRHSHGAQVHPSLSTLPAPGGPVGAARPAGSGLDGVSNRSERRAAGVRGCVRLSLHAGLDMGRGSAVSGEEEGSGAGQKPEDNSTVLLLYWAVAFCGRKPGVCVVDEPSVVVDSGNIRSTGKCVCDLFMLWKFSYGNMLH